jgi:alpha-L-fucosidase
VKPLARLVHLLVGAVGRDGNFILNVGPRPDGEIDPPQAERLREIGDWLKQNGESIYGTRGGPWLPGDYGVSTHRGRNVYLHILTASENRAVVLPNLPIRIVRVTSLKGDPVSYTQDHTHIRIISPTTVGEMDVIIKIELAEPWNTSAVVPAEFDRGWPTRVGK